MPSIWGFPSALRQVVWTQNLKNNTHTEIDARARNPKQCRSLPGPRDSTRHLDSEACPQAHDQRKRKFQEPDEQELGATSFMKHFCFMLYNMLAGVGVCCKLQRRRGTSAVVGERNFASPLI